MEILKKYSKYIFVFLSFFLIVGCGKMKVEPIENELKQGEEETTSSVEGEKEPEEIKDIIITLKYDSDIADYECKARDGKFECENPEPVKTGYTFIGWFTEYDTEKTLSSTFSESMTLKAKWKANTYKISFNINGGTGGEYQVLEATYDESMPALTATIPTKDNHRFMGWYDNADPSRGKQYYDNANKGVGKYTLTSDVTLFAAWASNTQTTYTVSFDKNGGTGSIPNSVQATFGFGMPNIGKNKPTKSGYKFIGWYDSPSYSGGKRYYDASNTSVTSFDKKSNLKLYAAWKLITYTVKFDLNGGKGKAPSSLNLAPNSTMPNITTTPPTKTGYDFLGWYDNKNYNKGTKYYTAAGKPTRKFDKSANCTLYAGWSQSAYMIKFNLNGGSGTAPSTINVAYNSTLPGISTAAPTRAGYEFMGWYDNTNYSNGTKYYTKEGVPTKVFDQTSNVNLYAGWKKETYTVSFNLNGGNGTTPSSITTHYNDTLPNITTTAPTKTGYNFLGWYDKENYQNGTKYYNANGTPAKTYDKTKNSTMYAAWEQNVYTVSFNLNGGSGTAPSSYEIAYNSALMDLSGSPKPTRTGYTFMGWYDNSSIASGTQYYNSNGVPTRDFDKHSNLTLYAGWSKTSYTVSFNLNGGNGTTPESIAVNYNGTLPTITTAAPTRSGYTFKGYYDNQNYSNGTKYYNADGTPAKAFDKTSNTTLYAGWQQSGYTVSFNINGGVGTTPSSVTAYNGQAMPTIPNVEIVKMGYTFTGWYDDNNVKYYNADGTSARNYDKTSGTTLKAGYTSKNFITDSTELANFLQSNNVVGTGYKVYRENRMINQISFPIYIVYKESDFTQETFAEFLSFVKDTIIRMEVIDSRVINTIKNGGSSLVYLGSYEYDGGYVEWGLTFAAYCNSQNRNLVMAFDYDAYTTYHDEYYLTSMIHEAGHAYDITIRYNLFNEIEAGMTALTLSQITNGYGGVASSQIKPFFYHDSNTYYSWRQLANDYAESVVSCVPGFSAYDVDTLKTSSLEFYAEVFNAYFNSYEHPQNKERLHTCAPLIYSALETSLNFYG